MISDLLTGRVAKANDIQLRIVEYALSPKTISRLHQVCRDLRDMPDDIYQMANTSMFGSARVHAPLALSRKLYNIMVEAFPRREARYLKERGWEKFASHERDVFRRIVDEACWCVVVVRALVSANSTFLPKATISFIPSHCRCPRAPWRRTCPHFSS